MVGTTRGYIFSSQRSRRLPVVFKTIVPVNKTIERPRYIRVEDRFSQPIDGNEIHDCWVVVNKNSFLVTAYWKEDHHRNRAVEAVGKGLRWRGEIAVVQVRKIKPFYKRPKNPSSINKAVARSVLLSQVLYLLLAHFCLSDSLRSSICVWRCLSHSRTASTWTTDVCNCLCKRYGVCAPHYPGSSTDQWC